MKIDYLVTERFIIQRMGCDWYTFETLYLPNAIRVKYQTIKAAAEAFYKENSLPDDADDTEDITDEDSEEIIVDKIVQIYLQKSSSYCWLTKDDSGVHIFISISDLKSLSTIEVPGPYEIEEDDRCIKTIALRESNDPNMLKIALELEIDDFQLADWIWSTTSKYYCYTQF